MLVIEGQRVDAVGRAAQRVEVGVGAEHHVRAHLRGWIIGAHRQHPQALTQRDRGLVGHPGQLTATHHCYLRHGAYAAMHPFMAVDQRRYAPQGGFP